MEELILGLITALNILIWEVLIRPMATMLSICWGWVGLTALKTQKPFALKIARLVSAEYFAPEKEWAGFIADYLNRLIGAQIDVPDMIKTPFGVKTIGAMEEMGKKFLMPMLAFTLPSPDEIQTNPMAGINRFMGMNLSFNMSGWILHLINEMFSFGKFQALGQLPRTISSSFGFARLSRFALGPSFKVAVVDPMTKLLNKIYTPETFTKEQAAGLVRHGLITQTDYINLCLDAGFSPTRAAMLYELGEKELTDAWLKRLTDMGWIKDAEIQKELTRRGFSPERAMILSKLIIDDRKLSIIDKLISAAADLYKDGVLDRTKLTGYLSKANYTADEIELYIAQLDLEKSRRRFLTQAQVVQLWLNKKLGRVECKNYLVALLSMTPEDAELYMSLKSPT